MDKLKRTPGAKGKEVPVTGQQDLDINKGIVNSTISKDETGDARDKEYELLSRFDNNIRPEHIQPALEQFDSQGLIQEGSQVEEESSEEEKSEGTKEYIDRLQLREEQRRLRHEHHTPTLSRPVQLSSLGNHKLQDLQLQLKLMEQQKKKRLLIGRQPQNCASTAQPAAMMPAIVSGTVTSHEETGAKESTPEQA
ncbi:MAG: hypothetical protein M1822_002520 [Bathelium mastoideum]|nr:MAG: hypothetical protein M1822_002520 [Bathelium mastoideum]